MPNTTYHQEHMNSFVVRCSFCENIVREDVPVLPENHVRHGSKEMDTKRKLDAKAAESGWKRSDTTHGNPLNFCPDHVNLAIEMGVLK